MPWRMIDLFGIRGTHALPRNGVPASAGMGGKAATSIALTLRWPRKTMRGKRILAVPYSRKRLSWR